MNQLFTKDELNNTLGKENFWNPTRLVGRVAYISGIPAFDELLEGKLFTEIVAVMNLRVRPEGLQIEMLKGVKYYSVALKKSSITRIAIEDQEQLYALKEKSVLGRAVVGGLLLGPVGAIVGGMTGVGAKQVKEKMPEQFITIIYNTKEGKESVIVLSCKFKDRSEVANFLKKNYPLAHS